MRKPRTRIGSIVLALALVLTLLPASALAANTTVSTIDQLTSALSSAQSGDIITLSQDIAIQSPITVSEAVTITSQPGVIVTANTSGYSFKLSGGAVLDGLTVRLAEKANVNIVNMQSGSAVKNCHFTGSYQFGDNEVSRAIEGSGGELTITGNTFQNLRQPAYINACTGTISENYANETRGWVICGDSDMQITGNTFGTNAVDIAIINSNGTDHYADQITALSKNNSGAYVQDQLSLAEAEGGSLVVGKSAGYTLDKAVAAAQSGDTVKLLSDVTWQKGSSYDVLTLNGVTLDLNGHTLTAPNFSLVFEGSDFTIRNGGLVSANGGSYALFIGDDFTSNVLLEGLRTTGGINIYNAENVVLRDVDVTGTNYYAVWCDEEGKAVIESGTFRSGGPAVLGLAKNENSDGEAVEVHSALAISGGNFIVSDTQKLVFKDDKDRNDPVISGGYFTSNPGDYVAEGKSAVAETNVIDGVIYSYIVKDKTVSDGGMDTAVSAGTPSVTVPENSGISKEQLESALKDAATTGSLSDAAADLSTDTAIVGTKEEAIEKLGDKYDAGIDTVTVVVEPYLDVTVTEYDSSRNTLTMEIDAYYNVKATTDPSNMTEGNTVTLKEDQPMTVTTPVVISIPLPTGFPTDNTEHLYVRHSKDGRVVGYHEATVSDSILTFTNDKGFSTFDVVTDTRSAEVAFDSGIGTKSYGPAAVGEALPTAPASTGKVYVGWTFAGIGGTHTVLTDDLLTKLAGAGGTVAATAVYRDTGVSDGGSSNGSSGGSSSSSSVTVAAAANGSVSVSPRNAAKGSTVTITVKPATGYVLDSLTVTTGSGAAVTVTRKSDTHYTFTMPAGTVTVKASFVKAGAQAPAEMDFSDVDESYWAYDEIKWAFGCGYMNGTSDTTFTPGSTVTRQQVWMILARMAGADPADMAEAKAWAVENGISDGTIPGGAVSRQQLVALLYRFASQNGYDVSARADLSGYPDAGSLASYAGEAMAWSVANGIIGGTTQGTLNPAGSSTRAQFAVILWRFFQISAI